MAFVCAKQDELSKKRATLDAIADIVNELKKEYENEMTDVCCPQNCPNIQQQHEIPCEPPKMMKCCLVCREEKNSATTANSNSSKKSKGPRDVIRVKQSKSRELRASIMYVGCDCEKRNGLQDDCQRTECHGSPECLTSPSPTCGPSEFCNGKHLGKAYPTISTMQKGSGAQGGVQQQHGGAAAAAAESLECEYQCFPLEGLDFCCCEYDEGSPNSHKNPVQQQQCCRETSRLSPVCSGHDGPLKPTPPCRPHQLILWCLKCNAPACLCNH